LEGKDSKFRGQSSVNEGRGIFERKEEFGHRSKRVILEAFPFLVNLSFVEEHSPETSLPSIFRKTQILIGVKP
jgi:hypothetical protein